MWEFLSSQFNIYNVVGQIMFSLLWASLVRIITWIYQVPLHGRIREAAFWVSVPALIFLFISFAVSLSSSPGEYTRDSHIKVNIDSVNLGNPGNKEEDKLDTVVLLTISVRNVGNPTIVEGWSLAITPPGGGRHWNPEHYILPETLTLVLEEGPVTLYGFDALYNKTVISPLPKGGMRRGLLLYKIKKVKIESLAFPGTKYTLSYSDVYGKIATAEYILSDKPTKFFYTPGLTMSIAR